MYCENWIDYPNSFDGKIKYFEDISVDNFYDKNKKAYFLSHFHADHYGGLVVGREKSHAEEHMSKGPIRKKIYMTEITEMILQSKYPSDYEKLCPYIVTLETGKTHKNLNNLGIDVTLQEVTHMPGAVMFIFAKPSCKVLYTGDFVMKTKDEKELKEFESLHDGDGNPLKFNYMYYDDAFEDKGILPTRAECIENLVTEINNCLKLQNNVVELITYYDYGFEELFAEVSMRMVPPMKIYNNDQQQMEVYDYKMIGAQQPDSVNQTQPSAAASQLDQAPQQSAAADQSQHMSAITISSRIPEFWRQQQRLWFHQFNVIVDPQKMYKLLVVTFVFGAALAAPAIVDNVMDPPVEETVTAHELTGGDLDSFFDIHHVPSVVDDAHSSVQDLNITVEVSPEENTADRTRRSVKREDKVEEDSACIKNGQKGTCVPYYQCPEDSKDSTVARSIVDIRTVTESDADSECPSYVETCCLKKLEDISAIIDIQ